MATTNEKSSFALVPVVAASAVRLTNTNKVVSVLSEGPAHIDDLMAATGMDEVQVRSAIRRLRDRGLFIAKISKKTFAWLPARGLPFKEIERQALANLG